MGHFDAEKTRAAFYSKLFTENLGKVQANSQRSTLGLRGFIQKVEKNEAKLGQVAKTCEEQLEHVDDVETSIKGLEGLLIKAKGLNDVQAAQVFTAKSFGRLLNYGTFNKTSPAKAQLVKQIEEAITREVARGKAVLAEVDKAAERWNKLVEKHMAACAAADKLGGTSIE